MLPVGAVHLDIPGIANVCKALAVDYADAVVGFKFYSRKACPVIAGIVTANENKQLILEVRLLLLKFTLISKAYQELIQKEKEQLQLKISRRARLNWKKAFKSVIIFLHLQNQYGEKLEQEQQTQTISTGTIQNGSKHEKDHGLTSADVNLKELEDFDEIFSA